MKMPCHGKWDEEDRICCLCYFANPKEYEQCKLEVVNFICKQEALKQIRANCAYACVDYDEYYPFDACNRNSRGSHKHQSCTPSEKCLSYEGYAKKK